MTTPNTIILKGRLGRYEEGKAAGAIKPGHLIKLDTNNELVVHPTAGGFAERAFAIEDAHQAASGGLGHGNTIDDAYADDDTVMYYLALPGDEIYALLPASATAVVKGDILISSGDGTLKKTTGSPTQAIAIAREAVDNSAGGSVARIKVRVI